MMSDLLTSVPGLLLGASAVAGVVMQVLVFRETHAHTAQIAEVKADVNSKMDKALATQDRESYARGQLEALGSIDAIVAKAVALERANAATATQNALVAAKAMEPPRGE